MKENMTNLNTLAQVIALREKGKSEVNIAQIKEILSVIATIVDDMGFKQSLLLLCKLQSKGRKLNYDRTQKEKD